MHPAGFWQYTGAMLDSISLFLDDPVLLKGPPLSSFLNLGFGKYQPVRLTNLQELASPRISSLPEVFQKRLSAYSKQYFDELNEQNRLADLVRYNFSEGVQVSARDIFRHPLLEFVPPHLLPQTDAVPPGFSTWSLLADGLEAIPELRRLEEILQALLSRIAEAHRLRKLELYLQTPVAKVAGPARAMKIESLEFDPALEVDWRVDFQERAQLESEFALLCFRKKPLAFYRSFSIDGEAGVVLVHPWFREFRSLSEKLASLSDDLFLRDGVMPSFSLDGELEAKAMLKYLKTRTIPVSITGESRTLRDSQSRTEVHLRESGEFFIQHQARIFEQKNLVRKGWTARTSLYLHTLQKGLTYLLGAEAKDLASRSGTRRDWDLKLLKNLGVLHFVFFETLSFYFEGRLSDGTPASAEILFRLLQPGMQKILIAGPGESFVRGEPLDALCSRPVLACFDEFVRNILVSVKASEAFYSEQGEVILEGVVEREFRLLYHVLLAAIPGTAEGALDYFVKAKKTVLAKALHHGGMMDEGLLHFPAPSKLQALPVAVERLQQLIPFGFALFLNNQPLQELKSGDLDIDFVLRCDGDTRFFNWFELSPRFFLHGEEVSADEILKLGSGGIVEHDGRYFAVPKDQWATLSRLENFWFHLQKAKTESSRRENGDLVYQLPRHRSLELLALRASGVSIRGDESWQQLCRFYDELGTESVAKAEFNLPATIRADVKPYQKRGVRWLLDLYNLRFGALLADDMGLGKTLQTLAFLSTLQSEARLGPVLIVVPSSLIFNWQEEVAKFTPGLPLAVFHKDQEGRLGRKLLTNEDLVVVTTYGLLLEHEKFLAQILWNVVVFDEAQNLKNISAKRTSAARALQARFKVALTGTPMENHYGEFYSLIDLLVPGALGDLERFRLRFVNTEMVTREELEHLKLRTRPLVLRRSKREILDQLPPKQETKVSIAFEEQQKEIYRDIAVSYNNRVQETMAIQGEASMQLQMLTALLRLRQACSDPAALPGVDYDKVPPKLDALVDSLSEIIESGESALVFTQFLQTLNHAAELLENAGLPVFILHGGIPAKQRQKILADFKNFEGGAVLVMTLKTGGVGLNLVKASYVFHIEPWWNPAVESQASDRAHRMGQTKAVQVFKYIMHESLEEKIEDLQARKERKFTALFERVETEADLSSIKNGLTKDDFAWLLGLRNLNDEGRE